MSTESTAPRYAGPLPLDKALAALSLVDANAPFTRDGPRADVEYRDLGLANATKGAIGAKHIRAIKPFERGNGLALARHDGALRHRHERLDHISLRRCGGRRDGRAGGCLSQPAGVAHNVVARSD